MDNTLIGTLIAMMTIVIAFFLYIANKIDALRADVHIEMKDFHGRLCSMENKKPVGRPKK